MRRRDGRVLVLGQPGLTSAAGFDGQLCGRAEGSHSRPSADIRRAPEHRTSGVKWPPEWRLRVRRERPSVVGPAARNGQHVLFSTKSVQLVRSMGLLVSCAGTVQCHVHAKS